MPIGFVEVKISYLMQFPSKVRQRPTPAAHCFAIDELPLEKFREVLRSLNVLMAVRDLPQPSITPQPFHEV